MKSDKISWQLVGIFALVALNCQDTLTASLQSQHFLHFALKEKFIRNNLKKREAKNEMIFCHT